MTATPSTSAASAALARGTTTRAQPARARGGGDRERAADRPHAAVERELAGDRDAGEMVLQRMAGRGEERERDRQIVGGAFLAEVRRREIDGDAAGRDLEAGVAERRADAILALADARVGEPDGLRVRDAGREVDLDLHRVGVDADEGARDHGREHEGGPWRAAAITPRLRVAASSARWRARYRHSRAMVDAMNSAPLRLGWYRSPKK